MIVLDILKSILKLCGNKFFISLAMIPIRVWKNDAPDQDPDPQHWFQIEPVGLPNRQPLSHNVRVGQRATQRWNYIK